MLTYYVSPLLLPGCVSQDASVFWAIPWAAGSYCCALGSQMLEYTDIMRQYIATAPWDVPGLPGIFPAWLVYEVLFCFFHWDKVSHSPGWSRALYAVKNDLELLIPAFASPVLRLQKSTTITKRLFFFFF